MTHDYAAITRHVMEQLNLSEFKVACCCGTDYRTVKNWLKGSIPLHPQGELLLALNELCKPPTYSRPTIERGQESETT